MASRLKLRQQNAAHIFVFHFPKSINSFVVFDGYTKFSLVKIIPGEKKMIGYVTNGTFVPKDFKNYFVIQFDQPFISYGIWKNENGKIIENNLFDSGNANRRLYSI